MGQGSGVQLSRSEADLAAIDANLRDAMRFFGQATGRGGVYERAGITIVDSGIDYAVFNISLFTLPRIVSRFDFDERIKWPESHFQQRRVRWSHWVCLDLLPRPLRDKADDVFRARGLRRLTEAPGMLAKSLAPPSRALPHLRWRRVSDTETRIAFAHITSMSFDIPFGTCREVYEPERAWNGPYEGFVGFHQNTAVSTAALVNGGGVIGIYSVGTLPGYRRRGFAEALLRAVLAEKSAETGVTRYALQSTRAGYEMYRRMGFQDAGRFAVYLT
jgi:ribosomal protein S18 acetylase RimI-like enzyme